MQIRKLGVYIWRHSLHKINDYPFFKCSTMDSLRELTRSKLNEEIVASWMDKLLYRENDYYSNFLLRNNKSNVKRQLNYISNILISTVIRNDIGLRGGISPIFDEDKPNDELPNIIKMNIPPKAMFVCIDDKNFSPFSLIDMKRTNEDYIIPYSVDTRKLHINSILKSKIDSIAMEIINQNIDRHMFANCTFVAIDFFIDGNNVLPFECHVPGRGIGVHLLPFVLAQETKKQALKIIENVKKQIEGIYNSTVKINTDIDRNTTFHELDYIIASMLSDDTSSVSKSITIDVKDSINEFQFRDYEIIKNSIDQVLIDSPITNSDLYKIKNLLGNWVIVKTRINTPWWSSFRKKPEVLLVDNHLISRINFLIKKYGELIVQKLITTSLDVNNHFGELRTYYFIAR